LLPIEDYFEKAKSIENWLFKNFKIFEEMKKQNQSKRSIFLNNEDRVSNT